MYESLALGDIGTGKTAVAAVALGCSSRFFNSKAAVMAPPQFLLYCNSGGPCFHLQGKSGAVQVLPQKEEGDRLNC